MPRALHMLRTDALRRPKLLLETAQEGSIAELRLLACCCIAHRDAQAEAETQGL